MQVSLYLPIELHKALPVECTVSGLFRQAAKDASADQNLLVQAFAARGSFDTIQSTLKKYSVYFPEDEHREATELADRYLLSLSQLTRILLEAALFNAGKWPPEQKD